MLLRDTILTGPAPAAPYVSHLKTALPMGEAADVTTAADADTLVESVANIKLSTGNETKALSNGDTGTAIPLVRNKVKDGAFWKVAEDHLVPLKAPWLDFVPVRAEGTVLYDAAGREMLDFTSGQMSSLLGQYVYAPPPPRRSDTCDEIQC